MSGKELIDAYSSDGALLGQYRRSEVHERGLWHATVHCWVLAQRPAGPVLLAQRRAPRKTHPGKLDSSAGGHLLSGETADAVVRELEEELGVSVTLEDLTFAGVTHISHGQGGCDNEIANVFLLSSQAPLRSWTLDPQEAVALLEVPLAVLTSESPVLATEFRNGVFRTTRVSLGDFLPFGAAYWDTLQRSIPATP